MDDILQQLPDARATERLLAVLDRLEKQLKKPVKPSASSADPAELTALKGANRDLRLRHEKAREKLDALLAKLPGLFPELSDNPHNEAAA
jgi:hypothetical protein